MRRIVTKRLVRLVRLNYIRDVYNDSPHFPQIGERCFCLVRHRPGRQDEYRSWRVLCATARVIVSLCLVPLGNDTLEPRSTPTRFLANLKVRAGSQPRAHIFRSVSAKRTSFPLHTRASRFTRWGMRFPSECPHSVLEPRSTAARFFSQFKS